MRVYISATVDRGAVWTIPMPISFANRPNSVPNFASRSHTRYRGPSRSMIAISQLLRDPLRQGLLSHCDVDDPPALQLDHKEREDRTELEVVELEEVAGPQFGPASDHPSPSIRRRQIHRVTC